MWNGWGWRKPGTRGKVASLYICLFPVAIEEYLRLGVSWRKEVYLTHSWSRWSKIGWLVIQPLWGSCWFLHHCRRHHGGICDGRDCMTRQEGRGAKGQAHSSTTTHSLKNSLQEARVVPSYHSAPETWLLCSTSPLYFVLGIKPRITAHTKSKP